MNDSTKMITLDSDIKLGSLGIRVNTGCYEQRQSCFSETFLVNATAINRTITRINLMM